MGDRRQADVVGIRVDEGRKILLVKPSVAVPAATGNDQVDYFLLEALQNPRDRLTVLRLEEEIQRFLQQDEAQQLEFEARDSTSFFQLATQRVAQHYGLRSTVEETSSGSKVFVTKALDGKNLQRSKRLADIPPKLAIKQRTTSVASSGVEEKIESRKKNASVRVVSSRKSVEERKEEYNKARARIFQEESSSGDEDVCCQIEVVKVANKSEAVKDKEMTAGPRIFTTKDDKEDVRRLFKEESSVKMKPKATLPNRVAIIRDREKDRKDPDYDRSYVRYHQRGFTGLIAQPITPAYNDACVRHPAAAVCSSWMAPTPPAYNITGSRGSSFVDNTTYSSYGPYPSQDARFVHNGFSSYQLSSFQVLNNFEVPQQHYPLPVLPSYNTVNLHCPQHY